MEPARAALALRLASASVLAGVLACAEEPSDPEQQIREAIQAVTEAVEAGDVARAKEFVSESYRDDRGNDRRALAANLTFHTMRNRSIHLLTRVRSVELPEPGLAEVRVVAGMAGTPIPDASAARSLRADVYAFDLRFADEGDGEWRLVWAAWRPTTASDLL